VAAQYALHSWLLAIGAVTRVIVELLTHDLTLHHLTADTLPYISCLLPPLATMSMGLSVLFPYTVLPISISQITDVRKSICNAEHVVLCNKAFVSL
jgi:hypothetical protein